MLVVPVIIAAAVTLQCVLCERHLDDLAYRYRQPASNLYDDEYGTLDDVINDNWISDNIAIDERSQLENRDHEYISEHSPNSEGYQYISGGAGEGEQHLRPEGSLHNQPDIKSDETLPFYCHPPNPCPKGYSAKDDCYEFVEDTAEVQKYWIEQMQLRGMCVCDEEHMFNCPRNSQSINPSEQGLVDNRINTLIGNILDDNDNKMNPWTKGDKRQTLVAKKSPIVKRDVNNYQAIDMELDRLHEKQQLLKNPFMHGNRLPTYAKKMSLADA